MFLRIISILFFTFPVFAMNCEIKQLPVELGVDDTYLEADNGDFYFLQYYEMTEPRLDIVLQSIDGRPDQRASWGNFSHGIKIKKESRENYEKIDAYLKKKKGKGLTNFNESAEFEINFVALPGEDVVRKGSLTQRVEYKISNLATNIAYNKILRNPHPIFVLNATVQSPCENIGLYHQSLSSKDRYYYHTLYADEYSTHFTPEFIKGYIRILNWDVEDTEEHKRDVATNVYLWLIWNKDFLTEEIFKTFYWEEDPLHKFMWDYEDNPSAHYFQHGDLSGRLYEQIIGIGRRRNQDFPDRMIQPLRDLIASPGKTRVWSARRSVPEGANDFGLPKFSYEILEKQ